MEENLSHEAADEKMIAEAYQRLVDSYMKSRHRKHIDIIDKAFNFAKEAHKGVRRLSGEPYIIHPISVAQIACDEIGLGSTGICAALLHDVVEDTDYTVEDINNIFGPKIAQIVDGLTKISGGIFGDTASVQAESFKKLLLTMSDDIRVILIKISDRLHNMRTLGSQRPGKQYKIAGETLYIYAPLAHRLGLNQIKEELEDLSFSYDHPEEYRRIQEQLEGIRGKLTTIFDEFTAPIRQKLDEIGIKHEIKARFKRPYSIWNKMQTKNIPFEEVFDILAVRIIFEVAEGMNENAECFHIYALLSQIYKPHPDRMRDWVSNPKANGYQAVHTTLMSKAGKWIEVQIRSRRMDDIAEHGVAAHWKYKEHKEDENIEDPNDEDSESNETSDLELDKWLHTIKEILDDPQPNAIDFLDTVKLNLFSSEIFVVTPKGEFKTMPAKSTVLDFAFSIHTFLGTHCIGAKVNHKLVGISHELKSGDQVEILTSKNQKVEKDWIKHATTAKAKGKIMAILRREEREKQKEGEEILNEFFQKNDKEPNSVNINKLCQFHSLTTREELLSSIGSQTIVLGEADLNVLNEKPRNKKKWKRYLNILKRHREEETPVQPEETTEQVPLQIDKKKPLILNEETISRYVICDCCHPIPGDEVLGYIDENQRIIIHKRQCEVAKRLKASDGNQILAANWDTHGKLYFPATLSIIGFDRVGVLHQITGILSQQLNVNIHRLHIETNDGLFTAEINLGVHDVNDIQAICSDLKKIEEIEDVKRF